jgi:queuine/archaeosine tRNA-ribosyltransferase
MDLPYADALSSPLLDMLAPELRQYRTDLEAVKTTGECSACEQRARLTKLIVLNETVRALVGRTPTLAAVMPQLVSTSRSSYEFV